MYLNPRMSLEKNPYVSIEWCKKWEVGLKISLVEQAIKNLKYELQQFFSLWRTSTFMLVHLWWWIFMLQFILEGKNWEQKMFCEYFHKRPLINNDWLHGVFSGTEVDQLFYLIWFFKKWVYIHLWCTSTNASIRGTK